MITIPAGARILLATRPIDFRKGAHGLAAEFDEYATRREYETALRALRSKRQQMPPKKHGNIPL